MGGKNNLFFVGKMKHYTYLLKCADGSFYCGYTLDIKRRVLEHNDSKLGAKYTKGRRPVELYYFEEFDTKQEALQRELAIKKLPPIKKSELILSSLN